MNTHMYSPHKALKFATQKLEQDFVEMRKTDEQMNADLFRLMLDLARYREYTCFEIVYVPLLYLTFKVKEGVAIGFMHMYIRHLCCIAITYSMYVFV